MLMAESFGRNIEYSLTTEHLKKKKKSFSSMKLATFSLVGLFLVFPIASTHTWRAHCSSTEVFLCALRLLQFFSNGFLRFEEGILAEAHRRYANGITSTSTADPRKFWNKIVKIKNFFSLHREHITNFIFRWTDLPRAMWSPSASSLFLLLLFS